MGTLELIIKTILFAKLYTDPNDQSSKSEQRFRSYRITNRQVSAKLANSNKSIKSFPSCRFMKAIHQIFSSNTCSPDLIFSFLIKMLQKSCSLASSSQETA